MKEIYKTKAHIPCEQYGFLEVDLEGTPKEIAEKYLNIKNEFTEAKKVNAEPKNVQKFYKKMPSKK